MGNLVTKKSDIKINTSITSAHGSTTPRSDLAISLRGDFTSATGTYQVTGEITGGADTIDLIGSLVDDLGDPFILDKVHLIHARSTSASSSTMAITTDFPAINDVDLVGGAYITWINEAGTTLTGGSADTVTITGTNGDPYNIVVIGLKA